MFTIQDVNINYNIQTKEYIVTILTNNPILCYEIWEKNKAVSVRYAINNLLEDLISDVTLYNDKNVVKYTPTTLVNIDNSIHTLILTRMTLNACGNPVFIFKKNSVVFDGNVQSINSELPCGRFSNVRFDIDAFPHAGWYNLKKPRHHNGTF